MRYSVTCCHLSELQLSTKEDIEHIFFHCQNSTLFWVNILGKSTMSQSPPLDSSNIVDWIDQWPSIKNRAFNNSISWGVILPFCLWNIWLTRNNNLFNNKKDPVNVDSVINQALELHLIINQNEKFKPPKIILHVKWDSPDRGHLTLNIDGAVRKNPGPGGLGGTIRDHEGRWIVGFTERIPLASPLMAELLALKRGLQIAIERNLTSLSINTDSSEVINMIQHDHPLYNNTVLECRFLMQVLGVRGLNHVYREQNRLANALARIGAEMEVFCAPNIMSSLPVQVRNEWEADFTGTTFARKVCFVNAIIQGRDVAQNFILAGPSLMEPSNMCNTH